MSMFKPASKQQSKLRLALFAPSGAGKTYTALRIASGMTDKIAVIDTERGSASKYADRFNFDVAELQDKSIDSYVRTIKGACKAGYGVLIIDSMSHAWQELLTEIDKLARAKYKGNTWSAWSEGTPKQRELIDAILTCDCHVIATMRSKTEWQTETSGNGKSRPVRVGLAPEQGKGIEYEFDMLMEISTDHIANVIKDRTGKFQDAMIDKPGEDFGKALLEWLNSGDVPEKLEPQPESGLSQVELAKARKYGEGLKVLGETNAQIYSVMIGVLACFGLEKISDAPDNETLKKIVNRLEWLHNIYKPWLEGVVSDGHFELVDEVRKGSNMMGAYDWDYTKPMDEIEADYKLMVEAVNGLKNQNATETAVA